MNMVQMLVPLAGWDTRWDTYLQSAGNTQARMQHTKHSWTRALSTARARPAGTPTACPPMTPERALSAAHPPARGVEPMRWGVRPQCADDVWARRAPRAAHAKAQTVKYQARILTGAVGGGGDREALVPCGRTNLLDQTKCQSLLARDASRNKTYNSITRKICSMVFDKINGCFMNQS